MLQPKNTSKQLRAPLIACTIAAAFASLTTVTAQNLADAPERVQQQMQSLQAEKAARSPAQNKMDSQLIFAARQKRDGFAHKDVPQLRASVETAIDGRAKIDIDATVSAALLGAIRAAGGEIINVVPQEHAVRAVLPIENVENIAARGDVKFIRPAFAPIYNTGRVNSQGDVTHKSNQARTQFGANGAGVMVGVLSDSIDDDKGSLAAALQSGDLDPNKSFVLKGQAGQGEGEGLAMMEIVHDLAPGAKLVFATGGPTEAQMAQNIRGLAAAGCKIIIDDITFPDESPFQDGVIAKAVNDVSANGVLYFSSAANSGNALTGNSGTWEGNFVDGGANKLGHFHLFKQGTPLNTVTFASGNIVTLFWSDPLGASANDYDLVVYDQFGDIVGLSNNVQNGNQDPFEYVVPPAKGDRIAIFKYSGQPRFLHLDTSRGRLAVGTSGSTRGHNASAAANAFCVAAAPASTGIGAGNPSGPFPNSFNGNSKVENFTSDGFRRIFFNPNGSPITPGNFTASGGLLLKKPDITAADGVATTLPPNSGLNPFFGTSAAAPHAGAIAAQVLSHRLGASPAKVRAALNASAIDVMVSGVDNASGRGIIMAPAAVQAINNSATSDAPPADGAVDLLSSQATELPADTTLLQRADGTE